MDAFLTSSFGTFVMTLWHGSSAPSWHNFTYLAYGWLSPGPTDHHNLSLAVAQPSQAFLALLCLFRWPCTSVVLNSGTVICFGASLVPVDPSLTSLLMTQPSNRAAGISKAPITTVLAPVPLGRISYAVGINLVWAIMRIPFSAAGHHLSLPVRLELYLKEALANKLKVPYRSRSALARRIVDHIAATLPPRAIRVATDGGYATQAFLLPCPPTSMWSDVSYSRPNSITCHPHGSKASAGAAQKRRPDRLAQNLGYAFARFAPSPAGSGDLHPILGGDMAQRLPRTAHAGRGGLAPAPPGPQSTQQHQCLWASQAPGSLFQHRCGAVSHAILETYEDRCAHPLPL